MSLGKASIRRASAAGKKKVVEHTAENSAVVTPVDTEEVQAKFISKEVKEESTQRPVRLTEEMPTYLL